jgi:hypothetical protein
MSEPELFVTANADGSRAVIEWKSKQPIVELDVLHLELLIQALGHVRAQLSPAVPSAVPDPQAPKLELSDVHVLPSGLGKPVDAGCLFLARSSYFGWMDCPMSAEFCQALALWLQGGGTELSAPSGSQLQ